MSVIFMESLKIFTLTIEKLPKLGISNVSDLDLIENLLNTLISDSIHTVYCWNADIFFAYIDAYAYKNNYPDYLSHASQKYYIDRLDSPGSYFMRKLKFNLKKYNSRHYKSFCIKFINVQNLFGGISAKKVCGLYNLDIHTDWLVTALTLLNEDIYTYTGLSLFNNNKLQYWTLGSIAKDYYLKLKYPLATNPLRLYQYEHPRNEEVEFLCREGNLLPMGVLYLKEKRTYKNVIKYDINSLFLYLESLLPDLTLIKEINYKPSQLSELLETDKTNEFIIIFDYIEFKLKPGYPDLFNNPEEIYKGDNKKFHILSNKSAFFKSYLRNLIKYYDICDFSLYKVYTVTLNVDNAIKQYKNNLYPHKIYNNNNGHRSLVKSLINNLNGKFAQLAVNETSEYYIEKDIIKHRVKDIVSDYNKRFDYIRGAYIYSFARSYLMDQIYKLKYKFDIADVVLYNDTDSLITSIPPKDIESVLKINETELGAFKIEKKYKRLDIYAPKIYAGIDDVGEFCLTAAGIKKEFVINYLSQNYGNDFNVWLDILWTNPKIPITQIIRTINGPKKVTIMRSFLETVHGSDDDGILYSRG